MKIIILSNEQSKHLILHCCFSRESRRTILCKNARMFD